MLKKYRDGNYVGLSKSEQKRLIDSHGATSNSFNGLFNPNDSVVSEEMAMSYLAKILIQMALNRTEK